MRGPDKVQRKERADKGQKRSRYRQLVRARVTAEKLMDGMLEDVQKKERAHRKAERRKLRRLDFGMVGKDETVRDEKTNKRKRVDTVSKEYKKVKRIEQLAKALYPGDEYKAMRVGLVLDGQMRCPCCKTLKAKSRQYVLFKRPRPNHAVTWVMCLACSRRAVDNGLTLEAFYEAHVAPCDRASHTL